MYPSTVLCACVYVWVCGMCCVSVCSKPTYSIVCVCMCVYVCVCVCMCVYVCVCVCVCFPLTTKRDNTRGRRDPNPGPGRPHGGPGAPAQVFKPFKPFLPWVADRCGECTAVHRILDQHLHLLGRVAHVGDVLHGALFHAPCRCRVHSGSPEECPRTLRGRGEEGMWCVCVCVCGGR